MNGWLFAAFALLLGLIPCVIACMHGTIMGALVALQMASVVATLVLLVLAVGFHRSAYLDVALCLAVLSFAGGVVFARFIERWL